jgi:hypothetical protein
MEKIKEILDKIKVDANQIKSIDNWDKIPLNTKLMLMELTNRQKETTAIIVNDLEKLLKEVKKEG